VKKVVIALAVFLIAAAGFFSIRYISLDVYQWDTDKDIVTYKDMQYECEPGGAPLDINLGKQIGKVEGEPSFRIWSIQGENIEDRIALNGFMFPTLIYKRIE
jgi:hypothetical protein